MQAFVDESERGRYLVAAVLVRPVDMPGSRSALRGLCKPGQRRVHFAKESTPRRRAVLSVLGRLPLRVWVYECSGSAVAARARCIGELVRDLQLLGADRLVLERLDPQVRADVSTIRGSLKPDGTLRYEHVRA